MDFAYTLSGFVVGFIVGLTGVGGGSLMTPLLVLVFGVNPAIAVGTDLLYAAITKCGGILVHHKQRTIDWRIVRFMAAGSLPGAVLTLLALRHFQREGIDYTALITSTLGVALILTSLVLLFKRQLLEFSYREPFQAVRAVHRQLKVPATVLLGLVIGVLVTLSSVGAGALGAAALFFLYPRLPAVSIVGSDLAHAVPLTAVAGLGHAHLAPWISSCSGASCSDPCRGSTWAATSGSDSRTKSSVPSSPACCCSSASASRCSVRSGYTGPEYSASE